MSVNNSNSSIRVCALVPYAPDTTPSQRYRIEQWLPYLKAQNITVDLLPFVDAALMRHLHKPGRRAIKAVGIASRFARRFLDVASARAYDVVLIHRAAALGGPALLERLVRLSGKPVIFDFDDAIFLLHTTEANRRFGWLKFPGKTATICGLSAHVVAGNSYLADYARRYNSRVTVIPSSVDADRYRPAGKSNPQGRVVVGWMGSSTSQTHLEMFASLFAELAARRDIELRVVSDREPVLPGVPFTWRRWSAATEVQDLAQFDIGIMPMPDDPWSRGKCAMKALLYMSVGVPTVCSAVGANCDVIQHGENGFLAATNEDWIEHLEALIDSAQLRQRVGAAGRQTIEQRYSTESSAGLFVQVIRETLEATASAHGYRPSTPTTIDNSITEFEES
jgi:glycosyltransferase involved in cell wall biosynthesis